MRRGKRNEAPRKGHGRNGADAYAGAEKVVVPHESLQPGDPCPKCDKGTVYETGRPGVLVRLVGQAPIQAKLYELQKLRCNLCGVVFTAQPPEGVGTEKYDATAGSMIGLLKYGSGMPFNRLEGLQGDLGIPLPASTQWEIVRAKAEKITPALEELIRQAAQGEVLHNDDTTVKILEFMGARAKEQVLAEDAAEKETSDRRGMFTSGVVSTKEGRKIALFFSGRKHAGENLADVLAERSQSLAAPIQMCDALTRNLPAELETIVAHCLAHGRRRFVEVADRFPEQCRYVLESLAVIYRNDAIACQRKLSPSARRHFHQMESGPVMEELRVWLGRQLEDRLAEPNSSLGVAISYMLKHWEKLTLFLRVPGAPLGRVEVWRGGLGFGLLRCQGFPVRGAISDCRAPFPHPAHRTGRADFPHPALLQNFRTSLSARLRGFRAVGTAPASRTSRRRDTVCIPCRDAVLAA